jgi:hypothetical protein
MASESNSIDFGASVFKFSDIIINVGVIFICDLQVKTIASILKIFISTYTPKFSNCFQFRKVYFLISRNISNFQVTKSVIFYGFQNYKTKLRFFLAVG